MTYNQTQGSSALGVNEEEGRDGRQDLNGTVSKRGIKSFLIVVTDSLEDTRTIERDDCMELTPSISTGEIGRRLTVDAAHLLSNHNGRCAIVCPSDTTHGKAIRQTTEVSRATGSLKFLLVKNIRVVVIPCRKNRMSAKTHHRPESLCIFPVLHEPTGRLWAEVDSDCKEQRWDEGRSELKTPSDVANIFDDDVGAETKEYACGRNSVRVPFCQQMG